jgi:O-antigen/teichoic acid export membrane protein
MMADLRQRLRGGFLGDVLKLSFGTLAGRLIALAALPLSTRLYAPEDFVLLAVFLALVNTLAVVACLRLEIAIPIVETDAEAADLLALALLVTAGLAIVIGVPALLIPDRVAQWLGNPAIAPFLWLVPLGVAMAGSYSALQYWTTRARRFGDIARTRVGQALAGVTAMLALGWLGFAPFGLLLGNVLNIGAGGISLAVRALRHAPAANGGIRFRDLGKTLHRNRRYPLLSTPEALLNIVGVQAPVLLIAAYAGTEAGYLFLAMQVMAAPMALLGSSIAQVYLSRAPQEFRAGNLAPFTLGIMRRLVVVGVGPLLLAGAVAPHVFPWLFGPSWARSGEIMAWLVPWMALQFITSPVSMVMYVTGRQRAMLALTAIGLVQRVGAVAIALTGSLNVPVLGFVLGSIAYYLTVLGFVLVAAGAKPRDLPNLLKAFGDWRVILAATLATVIYLTA